ncbi:unnamed protein product [Cuscuta epithymum]|uniref:Pectinesterase n=1 Tax=Cuscuta epithymum TaxID=186058 RepID=A0AAV0FZU3_9ASTE|nr:unnamed protein product [Cuscuta epithymum]
MTHLMIMGDGPTKTRITGKLNYVDGISTFHTATVAALGDYFMAKDIGFENAAGPEKHQAVALRVGADRSIFYNCQMDGYQDTLYAHLYRQFYRNCVISGTIDFIFGNSAAVLQNCTLVVRKPLENQQCIVTAQGRIDPRQPTGLVLQNCSFVADPEYQPVRFTLKSYLGRPWKEYSRTVIMESYLEDFIQQDGWLPWAGDFALETLFYAEYNNRGPASGKENRVKWGGVKELPLNRIERFTAARFLQGETWIKTVPGLPYNPGFIFPPPKPNTTITYSPVEPDETKDMVAPEDKAAYDPPKVAPAPAPVQDPVPVSVLAPEAAPPVQSAEIPAQTTTNTPLPVLSSPASSPTQSEPPSQVSAGADAPTLSSPTTAVTDPAPLSPDFEATPSVQFASTSSGSAPAPAQDETSTKAESSVVSIPVAASTEADNQTLSPAENSAMAQTDEVGAPSENGVTTSPPTQAAASVVAPPTETEVKAPSGNQESKGLLGGLLDF